ncbi:hypothetical protein [Mucisphaera sp.]|uniref:hypothetical protein n=1 Tax=Mucisphaera sp. TaxID=2913024 RepID=UPI003D0C91A3
MSEGHHEQAQSGNYGWLSNALGRKPEVGRKQREINEIDDPAQVEVSIRVNAKLKETRGENQ